MKINEIFYSLQGEGFHSGTPAVFVRFCGCNLHCPFCDTRHQHGTDLTEAEVVEAVLAHPAAMVVATGGEPSLQLTASLVEALHAAGRRVHVETNGTRPLPGNVDWVTLSPKDTFVGPQAAPVLQKADELKLLFDGRHEPDPYRHIDVGHRLLQPCDTGDARRNAAIAGQAVAYCLAHPEWRLSLQTHKTLNIQ